MILMIRVYANLTNTSLTFKTVKPGYLSLVVEALLGGGYPCPLSEIRHQPCGHFARFLCRLSEFRLGGIVSGNLTLFG